MPDLIFSRSGELDVTQVQGETEEGVDFVDAYVGPGEFTVVDSGRIIVPTANVPEVVAGAVEEGLSFEHESVL